MDERVSSAVYNPFNEYDISTARGNQRLGEAWERQNNTSIGSSYGQAKVFLLQLIVFGIVVAGLTAFG